MIKPGQTYRSADPRDSIHVRVTAYTPYSNLVEVVDAVTGKRPRRIRAVAFHATATTHDGKPRRTGYVLEEQP